jgi:hypothetical protein
MRLTRITALIAGVITLASACPVCADIVFDSGVPPAQVVNATVADSTTYGEINGSTFALGSSSVINEVQWSGIYNSSFGGHPAPATDNFTVQFIDYSGTSPTTSQLFSYAVGNAVNRTDTGIKLFGFAELYTFDAVIPDTSLASGRYLVTIFDATAGDGFAWSFGIAGIGNTFLGNPSSSSWSVDSGTGETAFTLLGSSAVPEPSTLIMLLIGVTGAVAGSLRERMGLRNLARWAR